MEMTFICVNHRVRRNLGQGEPQLCLKLHSPGCFSCPACDLRVLLDMGSAFHGFFYLSLPISKERKEGRRY